MDKPAIHAAEAFVHAGYPLDVEALLIVELDGPEAEVDDLIGAGRGDRARAAAPSRCRVSSSEEERLAFWAGRKAAFPAVGRISPDYYCMDGTIPRRQLPQVLSRIARDVASSHGLRVANVFHAGDGNLHPLILYDANKPGELERGRGVRRRHPEAVRRGRRRADRRARRRRREARPDGRRCSPRPTWRSSSGVKCAFDPGRPAQPRQGVPDAAPLRRAGPHARPPRPAAASPTCRGSDGWHDDASEAGRRERRLREAVRWAVAEEAPLELVGGGTKRGARPAGPGRRIRSTSSASTGIVALRAGGAGADRAAPATPLARDRGAAGREPPDARLRAARLRRRCSAAPPASRRSAACSPCNLAGPAADQGRGGARPLPRLHGASAAAARCSRPAAGWSRTSPATTCRS